MKSLLVIALLLAAGTAHAGGYVGLGVGDGVGTSGGIGYSADGRSGRLLGGFRFGKLSAEASIGRASLTADRDDRPYVATQMTLSAKYSQPLSDGFEVFGRLGLHRIALNSDVGTDVNWSGKGILFGGGAEYRPKLPLSVSFWVDYTLSNADMDGPSGMTSDLTTRQWMIGASLGI